MNKERKFSPSLRQLRAFVTVYQLRKLSAAAERLFITQSAVSVLIRQLEDGLGTRLFDRTTRSLQPTQAAQEALAVAERILRDVDSLGAGLQDLTGLRRGRVCVAITPTLAEILLPSVIRTFTERHPEIRVVIDDCAPDQFVPRIIGEQVDFGIGTPERSGVDVDAETLVRDHLSLVCTRDHPLASRKTVRWRDLEGLPLSTVRTGYGIRPLIDLSAAKAGVSLNVINEVAFLSTALWMTGCGLGVAVMPAAYVTYSRDPGLMAKTLTAPKVSRDISVVTKRGRSLSPAAQCFIDVLRTELALVK
ncbi:MAG: LysR family transcriptional regulator [Hylemonella sp.]|nr:LysR family transcriptional regulator [Hylemonella sp.]MDP1936591.1 LysR family transcriptional regulator [Hylemonella sp.]